MNEIHPDLQRAARFLPRGGIGPRSVRLVRPLTALLAKAPRRGVERVRIGEIGIRVHRPVGVSKPRPGLLWIHGGGYVVGSAAQDDLLCRELSRRLGIAVVAVEYRLAPERPFPVPMEDCYTALTWLADQPWVDGARIAVGGASAGGGLAASVALAARERGVTVALQLLSYPMLDDRTATRPNLDRPTFRLWDNKANSFGWLSYTGREPGSANVPLLAVPARVDDLAGLAPAWIGVGTEDLFYAEGVEYAERLRAAGVKCDLEVVTGAFHGFDAVVPKADVTRLFREAQIAALSAALG